MWKLPLTKAVISYTAIHMRSFIMSRLESTLCQNFHCIGLLVSKNTDVASTLSEDKNVSYPTGCEYENYICCPSQESDPTM